MIKRELEESTLPVPFYIESSVSNNETRVDIYGTINYPFSLVKNEFLVPTNWCEFVLPHPAIRACTYKKRDDGWLLNIYQVNKVSKPLEDAYQINFVYGVSEPYPVYFDVALAAHGERSHLRDHQFGIEAIPLENNMTFIHLRYSFGYSAWGYFLMKIFAGAKVGFSVIGRDSDGTPVYVDSLRGLFERDIACYYLAFLAYLDTLNIPAEQRFEKRVGRWYGLAALYKKQLLEMDERRYLTQKREDRRSQQRLQSDLNR
jgi:hypothetical protein